MLLAPKELVEDRLARYRKLGSRRTGERRLKADDARHGRPRSSRHYATTCESCRQRKGGQAWRAKSADRSGDKRRGRARDERWPIRAASVLRWCKASAWSVSTEGYKA